MDRFRARSLSRRTHLHFLGHFRQHWQKDSGLRIDHLLVSADLTPRLRNAGVDRWVRDRPHASDHAPTWIELDMGAKNQAAQRRRSTVKPS
jgi:exodeoxyribonuclease III